MNVEAACNWFFMEAKAAAIKGNDPTDALQTLTWAMHELRATEAIAQHFAGYLGCDLKDTWYILHDLARDAGKRNRLAMEPPPQFSDLEPPPPIDEIGLDYF